jgi:hypothetical protein
MAREYSLCLHTPRRASTSFRSDAGSSKYEDATGAIEASIELRRTHRSDRTRSSMYTPEHSTGSPMVLGPEPRERRKIKESDKRDGGRFGIWPGWHMAQRSGWRRVGTENERRDPDGRTKNRNRLEGMRLHQIQQCGCLFAAAGPVRVARLHPLLRWNPRQSPDPGDDRNVARCLVCDKRTTPPTAVHVR